MGQRRRKLRKLVSDTARSRRPPASASATARNGACPAPDAARPRSTSIPAPRARSAASANNRDFPTPASPATTSADPPPLGSQPQHARAQSSASRATNTPEQAPPRPDDATAPRGRAGAAGPISVKSPISHVRRPWAGRSLLPAGSAVIMIVAGALAKDPCSGPEGLLHQNGTIWKSGSLAQTHERRVASL